MLDLCCRAGGMSVGFDRAGLDVIGIDIAWFPDYPYPMYVGDALLALKKLISGERLYFPGKTSPDRRIGLDDITVISASWPCQAANPLTTGTNSVILGPGRHEQLIPAGREMMDLTGKPWVIENTAGAPIRKDLRLNGDMFKDENGEFLLHVWRPRFFEFGNGFFVPQPDGPSKPSRGRVRGWRHGVWSDGPYYAVYGSGGGKANVDEARFATGNDWMTDLKDLAESVPWRYAHYIGSEFLKLNPTKEGKR